MTKILMNSVALVALLAACAAPASAATLFQIVPVQGSKSTNVFGINKSQTITGSWLDSSGVEHGYVGPAATGSYTTFDDPTPGTEPRGLDNAGDVGGFGNSQSGVASEYIPFERSAAGTIATVVNKRGKKLNYLIQGFSRNGVFAGSYVNGSNVDVAYLGKNAMETKAVKLSLGNTGAAARGVDDAGDIVGWYLNTSGIQTGFLISGGVATSIVYPDASESSTVMEGINNKGIATGQWTDTSAIVHSFTYNLATAKFKPVSIPGAVSFTQAWGINDLGEIAVGSDAGFYIYCMKSICPGTGPAIAEGKEISVPKALMPSHSCADRACLTDVSQDPVKVPARMRAPILKPGRKPGPMLP
ncbi:MAG TPA: hypothetical protein VG274_12305 [Rhizomicrobium sp.]|nr:hypothetical protein [Rhizomicrobium sp.]